MDWAHPLELGAGGVADWTGSERPSIVRRARSARVCGSGLLSRNCFVSDLLVPAAGAGADAGFVPYRLCGERRCGLADLRLHFAACALVGCRELAMALHSRGTAGYRARILHLSRAAQPSG